MIAREGYTILLWVALLTLSGSVLSIWLLDGIARVATVLLCVLMLGFMLYFFRDVRRQPPANADNLLLAPADGRIMSIEEVEEPLYIRGPAQRISVFLSVFNVHVNRIPATGILEYDEYVPGEYLVAWHPKSSEMNERSQLGLRHPSGTKVLFKQIAGLLARRVVYHVTVGDSVQAAQRLGIIKLGSRMNVYVPVGVKITAQQGDRVRAGESILGVLQEEPQE